MGCYPSRADGVTALGGNSEAISPTASPTPVACCAPVRGHASSKKAAPSRAEDPPSGPGWVGQNHELKSPTPGEPSAAPTTTQTKCPQQDAPKSVAPESPQQLLPGALAEECSAAEPTMKEETNTEATPKYKAFVPVRGEFVPVSSSSAEGSTIDFDGEKMAIEAQFCSLEKALDEGTMERADIEKQFEVLTNQAARLRRLQAAAQEQEAPSSEPKPPVKLAPVNPPGPVTLAPLSVSEGSGSTSTMAVVHWKGVTKKKFVVYRDNILEKYGDGPTGIKSIERIPNRILITVPVPEVMMMILADESLDPRPEPYKLPGGNSAPKPATTLSKPGALQASSSSLLAPPDGLAPLRSPSKLGAPRAPSPFTPTAVKPEASPFPR
eukprot:TRINITY_DN2540_c0_g1_i7.p1 TRINITY_DN2540_c0_g1~~TRINITY_DN2540_c0_g1_i7.p1  ORF type:complete len:381 (-),score=33.25 TRINITY_DN2540_c0_g1_i7:204-1346(-)